MGSDPETATAEKKHPGRTITITVNEKPVAMKEARVTGLEIKEAAVAQGVSIELDFELAEELRGGRERIVGNDDTVTVTAKSRFIATAPDDNS